MACFVRALSCDGSLGVVSAAAAEHGGVRSGLSGRHLDPSTVSLPNTILKQTLPSPPMDANASLNRLLAVLAERDIGLGYDDLAWLVESPGSTESMISWVHEYLGSATLLSPEELELCVVLIPTALLLRLTYQATPSSRNRARNPMPVLLTKEMIYLDLWKKSISRLP